MKLALLASLALGLTAAQLDAKSPDNYGAPPDWDRFKELAEPAVLARLPDPDNWSVTWPHGYMKGGWRHKGRFPGYLSCGVLVAFEPPAKGRAVVNFVVVVDHDRVQTVDISTRESNSLVNMMCRDLVARGQLPPAALMKPHDDEHSIASLGLDIRVVPEGAYVTKVAQDSLADRAGIKPGMVFSQANGIVLGTLGPAMASVLASDVASLHLEVAGGGTFEIARRP